FDREGSERDEVHGFSQAAQANFVLADVLRQRSEAIAIPPGTAEEQHQVLERRAQLLLKAQTEYFNTIRYTDPAWAARAGYQIGALYDRMWATISEAPVPPPRRKFGEADMRIYEDEYRKEMARMIRPLVRHAIRYWELTLMMIERASVDSEWSAKLKADLEAARTRLRLTAPDDGDDAAGEDARQEPHVPSRGSDALAKPPAPAATTP
ncbi:MAG: hypothetical protein KC417_05360, partial [Myxococcales bacterium]|nr:hypothetical protein [Myxococcales bacterium]